MKKQKITIEEFYRQFNNQTRILLDNITGQIHQKYPNIKEKITYTKLTYTDTEKGKIIEIQPTYNQININFLKQKKTIQLTKENQKTQTKKIINYI